MSEYKTTNVVTVPIASVIIKTMCQRQKKTKQHAARIDYFEAPWFFTRSVCLALQVSFNLISIDGRTHQVSEYNNFLSELLSIRHLIAG